MEPVDQTQSEPTQSTPKSAVEKLSEIAAAVETAKWAAGIKGFFDPRQKEIHSITDEVLSTVPYADITVPIWFKAPDSQLVEDAAIAASVAVGEKWEDQDDDTKERYRTAAKAILALKK